ncbi:MAG: hypothetical protein IJI54_14375 [Kiritimatiellae bacterium]|nr:hypothetical protein [Kiritimatiellia bacterium]
MRHKIKNSLFLALLLALASPANAREVVSVSLPDPASVDCETTSHDVIPILETGTPKRLVVSIDCLNTATNEFEVWFCTDEDAKRESRDLVVMLDEGRLLVSRRDIKSMLPGESILPLGLNSLGVELWNLLYRQDTLLVKTSVNGIQNSILAMGVGIASPREWRSVRVVSRGVGNASDMTVTVSKGEVGFSVILR